MENYVRLLALVLDVKDGKEEQEKLKKLVQDNLSLDETTQTLEPTGRLSDLFSYADLFQKFQTQQAQKKFERLSFDTNEQQILEMSKPLWPFKGSVENFWSNVSNWLEMYTKLQQPAAVDKTKVQIVYNGVSRWVRITEGMYSACKLCRGKKHYVLSIQERGLDEPPTVRYACANPKCKEHLAWMFDTGHRTKNRA